MAGRSGQSRQRLGVPHLARPATRAAAAFMRAHVQRSALIARERVGEALSRMFDAGA